MEWIPCSERLPDQEGVYLVTVDARETIEGKPAVDRILWADGQWKDYQIIHPLEEVKTWPFGHWVIAWMPLPDPWIPEPGQKVALHP